jgi:hypothetical protein
MKMGSFEQSNKTEQTKRFNNANAAVHSHIHTTKFKWSSSNIIHVRDLRSGYTRLLMLRKCQS